MPGVAGRIAWRGARRGLAAAAFLATLSVRALGQTELPAIVPQQPTIATSLPANGDPTGTRRWLLEHGVSFAFVHTTEALSNLRGGIRRGSVFDGKLEAMVGIDFGRLAGLDGLTFYSNSLQLHGSSGPGRSLVGNLNTISNIEALPTTRLSEMWLEQQLLNGKVALRAG